MPARILLADARPERRSALELVLDTAEWTLSIASGAAQALTLLENEDVDVVICDPAMPGLDGFELAPQLLRRRPGLQVLVLAAREDSGRFAMATRLGAAGLVGDPVEADDVSFALRVARDRIAQGARLRLVERDLEHAVGDKPIIGASESMIELLEGMERAAGFKTPVLITGERGSHREVIARAIHAQTLRRGGPFVSVRCAGDDTDAVEAQIFGAANRAPGSAPPLALTADGGTLFLDEIDRLAPSAQQRIVELLDREEIVETGSGKARTVDLRLIATSTVGSQAPPTPASLVADLRDRLSPIVLAVPPLRDRIDDVPLLVDHAVARMRVELGVSVDGVSDAAMDRLRHYDWPGNLRELENVIERAMLLCTTDRISLRELPAAIATSVAGEGNGRSGDFSLRRARRSFEAEMIRRALRKTDGNRTRAARLLEISHRALLYKIKEFGLRD